MDNIPQDDPKVYAMMEAGQTEGVFQFESAGMRRTTMRVRPRNLEDLIAIISLYRPGPMQFIDMYVENRGDPSKISYRHPRLSKILDVTGGCIIYQEQVMAIFRELAGYSLGRADIVRRAMSKKKLSVLEKEKAVFIHGEKDEMGNIIVEGCERRGVSADIAEALFKEIENFASYAFNKSHAAAYATVSYQTAYLKCYYPKEYMAALISSVLGNAGKLSEYMEECHRLGIEVLPPHVNYSENGFTVVGGVIRYGLLAIKNLGRGVIARMIQERVQGGKFTSFYNFCSRMQGKDMNKRAVESLIKSGALDGLGNNRREMILAVGTVMDSLETEKRKNLEGQIGLFGLVENEREEDIAVIPSAEDFTAEEKLRLEKEVTGMYLSGHPMAAYKAAYDKGMAARIDRIIASASGEINTYKDEQRVNVLGVISSVKKKITKSNSSMAFVTLEDMYGSIEILVFPSVYENYMNFIREGSSVLVRGRVSFTEEKDPKILCDGVEAPPTEEAMESFKGRAYVQEQQLRAPSNEAPKEKAVSNPGLYLKVKDMNWEPYLKAMKYIEVFEGTSNVYIYDLSRKKLVRAPARYNVDINDILVRELKKLLGNGNVAIKMG